MRAVCVCSGSRYFVGRLVVLEHEGVELAGVDRHLGLDEAGGGGGGGGSGDAPALFVFTIHPRVVVIVGLLVVALFIKRSFLCVFL